MTAIYLENYVAVLLVGLVFHFNPPKSKVQLRFSYRLSVVCPSSIIILFSLYFQRLFKTPGSISPPLNNHHSSVFKIRNRPSFMGDNFKMDPSANCYRILFLRSLSIFEKKDNKTLFPQNSSCLLLSVHQTK